MSSSFFCLFFLLLGTVVYSKEPKITICHTSDANPHTLVLPVSAAAAHLKNHPHDALGSCQTNCKLDSNICDDRNSCTNDNCDMETGTCIHTSVNCDDGNPCTTDECDPLAGCINKPVADIPCDDHNPCTKDDKCIVLSDNVLQIQTGVCAGKPVERCCNNNDDCNDNNLCTHDFCNADSRTCSYIPVQIGVADPCTIKICNPLTGEISQVPITCPMAPDQCQINQCNPTTNQCETTTKPNGEVCDDGNLCTSGETCSNGYCHATNTKLCDQPPNDCYESSGICNPSTGACDYSPKAENTPCQDNDPNTCNEICDGSGSCISGGCHTDNLCNGFGFCMDDECHFTSPANCNDPFFIHCNQDTGFCEKVPCTTTADCPVNDDKCAPITCVDGFCARNIVICDVVGCNATCDSATGTCVVPDFLPGCDDNNPCTIERCNIFFGCSSINKCLPGQFCDPVTGRCGCVSDSECVSNNPCKPQHCDVATGFCITSDYNCDDGNSCTNDHCFSSDGTAVCMHVPVTCSDNNLCTNDYCIDGACIHVKKPDCCRPESCTNQTICNCSCSGSMCICNCSIQTVCTSYNDCNDFNDCTLDKCEIQLGGAYLSTPTCTHTPINTESCCPGYNPSTSAGGVYLSDGTFLCQSNFGVCVNNQCFVEIDVIVTAPDPCCAKVDSNGVCIESICGLGGKCCDGQCVFSNQFTIC